VKTVEFDYTLPPDLIAQTPVEPRDASRLMVVDRHSGKIAHHHFFDLPQFLQKDDLLVYNESRVIPARLFARKPTGGKVEILLLRQKQENTWETLVRGKHIQPGMCLELTEGPQGQPINASVTVIEAHERGIRTMAFDHPVLPLASDVGTTPLPPYIHTPLENVDRYQTIYARIPGSAAAPTAGLHFTSGLLHKLQEMGVKSAFVNLHIGLDTFRPVHEETIQEHHMHTEYCQLTPDAAQQVNQAKSADNRVIAVGTTSVRVLESAVIEGTRCVQSLEGNTNLFIYPGYQFQAVDAMITNFHLPRSTLLMLVAAFAGKDLIDRAYTEAIQERYRFYSFGDAMMII
jgi:S-adenosylmethionine:tRNA ribosyltransferase-isomerase